MGLLEEVGLLEAGLSVGVDKPAELSGEDLRVAVSMEGLLVEGVPGMGGVLNPVVPF